jgi:uncharacterized alkaline shock family protein YloU
VTGHASISTDILARYAGDAARDTPGVHALVPSQLPRHRGARVEESEDGLRVELHIAVEWGASIPSVGAEAERRVREYLSSMADVASVDVYVIVEEITPP